MGIITGIGHIGINCGNYEKSLAFYRDTVGLNVTERVMYDGYSITYLEMPGGMFLELFEYGDRCHEDVQDNTVIGYRHLAFEVHDVDYTERFLEENGFEIKMHATDMPELGIRGLLCFDPDGTEVEFYNRYNGSASVIKTVFGEADGQPVYKYTLSNGTMVVSIINYGARITEILVPDSKGKLTDVCLGYDSLREYSEDDASLGAVVGPVAGRISGAAFELDGKHYRLEKNLGKNTLHSGSATFAHKVWREKNIGNCSVTFEYAAAAGEGGFPGNLTTEVTYSLNADNELAVIYHAESDDNTPVNITNHCYFNLDGHDMGTVYGHRVCIQSGGVLELDSDMLPTGRILRVKDTPLDFSSPKEIGDDIFCGYPQLGSGRYAGYDSCYELDRGVSWIPDAYAESPQSGIRMEMYTDMPAIHFYTANFLDGYIGKNGAEYRIHSGFCMEAEERTDAVNIPDFEPAVCGPGKPWNSRTVYRFGAV